MMDGYLGQEAILRLEKEYGIVAYHDPRRNQLRVCVPSHPTHIISFFTLFLPLLLLLLLPLLSQLLINGRQFLEIQPILDEWKRREIAGKKIASFVFQRAMRPRGILMRFYERRFQENVAEHAKLLRRHPDDGCGGVVHSARSSGGLSSFVLSTRTRKPSLGGGGIAEDSETTDWENLCVESPPPGLLLRLRGLDDEDGE